MKPNTNKTVKWEVHHGVRAMKDRRIDRFSDYKMAVNFLNKKWAEDVHADLFSVTTVTTTEKVT